jgi:hypothetical protein
LFFVPAIYVLLARDHRRAKKEAVYDPRSSDDTEGLHATAEAAS